MCKKNFIIMAIIAILACGAPTLAQVDRIEEDFPLTIDSAYPVDYLGRELGWYIRYDRGDDGDDDGIDEFETALRLEFGFPRNGEIKLTTPFKWGEVEPDGVRPIEAEFMYNLNQETLWTPAFSLAVGAEAPVGEHADGFDPFGKILITKTISGETNTFQQVHFNALYRANDEVQGSERGYESLIALGYSRRITSSTLFVTDLVREWDRIDDHEENLMEFGLRYQITPLVTLSGGTGFGFGDESPDVRFTFGMQAEF